MNRITRDSIENIEVLQPADGYRFSIDSLLLADFAGPRQRDRVLELGAGCGIISMLLADRYPEIHITAIEIQHPLAGLAEKNIRINHMEEQIKIIREDLNNIQRILPAGSFDYVVSNPPYRPPDTGRICINSQEALARHEILTTLTGILKAARYALRPGGRIAVIYPADRSISLFSGMREMSLEPKRARFVHPDANSQARMILVEGCRDAGVELRVLQPLILKNGGKIRS